MDVVLFNAGLGPALRVEITATYDDERHPLVVTDTPPAVRPEVTAEIEIPIHLPTHVRGGVRSDRFKLTGTYLDRSLSNAQNIVTSWAR